MKEIVVSETAPAAVGAYSQAVLLNGVLYTSGQLPINPSTNVIVGEGIELQTKQVMENIGAILRASNMSFSDVVKTTIFLTNINDFVKVNDVYQSFFKEKYPARACFEVRALPKGANVEIEAIASRN